MTRYSVPGKVIVMGEHAAVYGRPALVAALGLRLEARIEPGPGEGVRIELPDVGYEADLPWSGIAAYRKEVEARWQAFAADGTSVSFRQVRGEDPAHVVRLALAEAFAVPGDGDGDRAAGRNGADAPPAMRLRVVSRIPVGAGFGSSAALAVAVLAAASDRRGLVLDPARLEEQALAVERCQHGTPSGVDGATVLRGGLVWAEPTAAGTLVFSSLEPRPGWLERLRIFSTGPPGESTGEVVAFVRERFRPRRRELERILDRLEAATRELRSLPSHAAADPTEPLRSGEAGLEELGVVPSAVRELVRQVEVAGGAAKISGAGSLAGPGAGSLLVYHPEPESLDHIADLAALEEIRAPLGAPGVRKEEEH